MDRVDKMDKNIGIEPLIPKHGGFRKQINSLANKFESDGGFTEKLYRIRKIRRGTF